MVEATAGVYTDECIARVRDDPDARLELLNRLYRVAADVDRGYLPYRRAASAGSQWWRALTEALLRDTCEASALAFGRAGEPRTAGAAATLGFIREPTAQTWYRAHNTSIASAYLANEDLAKKEGHVERFIINLVLVRVLYAHALVANPRLALGWLAPCGRLLGDPRLGMTAIFLSLSRVLPDRYPLVGDLDSYVDAENSIGQLLDVGIILPRLDQLYDWSATELGLPALHDLLADGSTPAYAWDPPDTDVRHPEPSRLARAARWAVRPG